MFPPPATTGHTDRREPTSVKKIKKRDADWTVEKELLGWLVDGDNRTVQLMRDKQEAYMAELKKLAHRRKIPLLR